MKSIRLSDHAREQLEFRGAVAREVEQTIRMSTWQPAERGRLACRRNFAFDDLWKGILYATKQIRVIFVDEPQEIVVVTVYVYYF